MSKEYKIETHLVRTEISMNTASDGFTVRSKYKDGSKQSYWSLAGDPKEYSARGGTSIYCPSCKGIKKCAVGDINVLGEGSNRNWYKVDNSDINWFRRVRTCRTCFYTFITAEVQEEFLNELVRLRDDIIKGEVIDLKDLSKYGENIIPFVILKDTH